MWGGAVTGIEGRSTGGVGWNWGRAVCLRHNNTIHWAQTWVLTPLWLHTMGPGGIETASAMLLVQGAALGRPREKAPALWPSGRMDGEVKGKERENRAFVYLKVQREGCAGAVWREA